MKLKIRKRMKILTIIGARPQFIKASMLSKEIVIYNKTANSNNKIIEEIIHTGQHYDKNMSDIFFTQLKIPLPVRVLNAGGLSHGEMTGLMLVEIEKEIIERKPNLVLVYGDTNSTLAGAIAAAKIHVPIVHVEAGLRSFNKKMPEEINRIVTDHLSELLFCPTITSLKNLRDENITAGVEMVGDIMYDAALFFGKKTLSQNHILHNLQLISKQFILTTIHRAENTNDSKRFKSIISALSKIANNNQKVVLPLHPRTKQFIDKYNLNSIVENNKNLIITEPVSYLEMIFLERNAKLIVTDSGGIQKEAYFHSIPCVTLRDETEWLETVVNGWNQLVGADENKIVEAIKNAKCGKHIEDYGKGDTANLILKHILKYSSKLEL